MKGFTFRARNLRLWGLLLPAMLAGCSFLEMSEQRAEIESAIAEDVADIEQMRSQTRRYKHIRIVDNLFVPSVTRVELQKPRWWFKDLEGAKGVDIALDSALQLIFDDIYVNFKFDGGLDSKRPVSFYGRTIGEALDSIASASGYSYQLHSDNVISWSEFETRTFLVAVPPGIESFGQGKGPSGTEGDNKNIVSSDEYIHSTAEYDPLGELTDELKTYSSFRDVISLASRGEEGAAENDDEIPIFLNRSAGTITVRDYPHVVAQMADIVRQKNDIYRTQVIMDVEVIEVKLTNENVEAFDLNLMVQELTSKAIAVSSSTTFVNSLSSSAGSHIISGEITKGRASGTSMLIEMLKSRGMVSNRTLPKVITHHNTVAKLRDLDSISYIRERSSTQTVNVGTEFTVIQDEFDVGFSLFVLPSVYEQDVNIRMATNMSTLLGLDRNGDGNAPNGGDDDQNYSSSYVESPAITHKDFLSRFTVRSGDTLLLAGLSREAKSVRENSSGSRLLGMANYGSSDRIETIIAITPRIQRPRL